MFLWQPVVTRQTALSQRLEQSTHPKGTSNCGSIGILLITKLLTAVGANFVQQRICLRLVTFHIFKISRFQDFLSLKK